jgi:hypothetical protein
VLKKQLDRLVPGLKPGHADRGRPVEANFADFKPAEHDWSFPDAPVTFAFKNRQFGEQFLKLNSSPDPGSGPASSRDGQTKPAPAR